MNKKVCAIVPSYNEAKRIGKVLDVLVKTKILDEIIVIDDGSNDNTQEILKKYKKVKYLRNKKNMGKAFSMELGVNNTNAEIIFFCDADLKGLKPEMIKEIVKPVIEDRYDMFIGLRDNFTQKMWRYTSHCSGERALRKKFWKMLPEFYKRGYRIESGLNEYVKTFGKGYGFKQFNYYQTGSEIKRGIINGLRFRIKMLYGVFSGMIIFNLYHKHKKF